MGVSSPYMQTVKQPPAEPEVSGKPKRRIVSHFSSALKAPHDLRDNLGIHSSHEWMVHQQQN